ncbi:hypothetical protein RINTHH_16800 [Richelia intracellularis HH01]|uniref:Uncharacterized protein n=1 Tax=Richelia intracellularis HH01 TaxID=1165094 RepID=M1X325_9NOST|nr:DUF1049 domain-containing protein [Richelia intracellularis]CCH67835.1 hypothetical protein RINTHH_16800 [Richelia intracellularis HH01]
MSLQNWLPALPLVFLGVKTQPLPLAIWILLSLSAGIFTSWLISTLNQFSSYLISKKSSTYNHASHEKKVQMFHLKPRLEVELSKKQTHQTDL